MNGTHFFESNTHLTEEGIALYVDALKLNRLDELPDDVREHVADCQACKRHVTGLYSLLADEDYRSVGRHPYFDRTKKDARVSNRPMMYRIAAAFLGIVAIGVIAYYITSTGGREKGEQPASADRTTAQADSLAAKSTGDTAGGTSGADLYAADFVQSPELEDMVNNESRSSTIEVVSPRPGTTVHPRVVFRWRTDLKSSLTLKVLTNREENVRTVTTNSGSFTLDTALKPGLYYWKLQTDDELLFVGKFLVRREER